MEKIWLVTALVNGLVIFLLRWKVGLGPFLSTSCIFAVVSLGLVLGTIGFSQSLVPVRAFASAEFLILGILPLTLLVVLSLYSRTHPNLDWIGVPLVTGIAVMVASEVGDLLNGIVIASIIFLSPFVTSVLARRVETREKAGESPEEQ